LVRSSAIALVPLFIKVHLLVFEYVTRVRYLEIGRFSEWEKGTGRNFKRARHTADTLKKSEKTVNDT